jgi:hypothetical protein
MFNEFDNVATAVSATVPNLFLRIDGEAISAAACRARADHLGTDTFKRDTAAGSFVFEPYGPRVLDFGGGDHTAGFRSKRRLIVKFIGA